MRFYLLGVPLGILFTLNLIGGTLTAENLIYSVLIIVIITAVTVGVLAGVNILGTGLGTESVHIAFMVSILTSFWVALSFSAQGIISTIPSGIIIWAVLSVVYVLGIGLSIVRGG